MEEKTLFKVALCCSIAGILVISLASTLTESKNTSISSLKKENIGKEVTITGRVVKETSNDKITKLEVDDSTGKISVTIFGKPPAAIGNMVEVTGELQEYKNQIEINANKIKEIKT